MKKTLFIWILLMSAFFPRCILAQDMPHQLTDEERILMPWYTHQQFQADQTDSKTTLTPPPFTRLRSVAEWEEISALIVTWTSYTSVLREIVRTAVQECLVYINCSDSASVKSYLSSGSVPLTNVRYIVAPYNSVWCRDYSANNVYVNDVDTLILCDWKYNRPSRPSDDTLPRSMARFTGLQLYEMSASPYQLIGTGGNYMSDGFGTAMASKLIDKENPTLSGAQIDTLSKKYLGITRYIRFDTLPYDGIHHIDMHMKLLDEETLLLGQFPSGVSDGPQIEANLQYLLSGYLSVFGTPYKIVRIPMPPDPSSQAYPPSSSYYTYTNGVFVNRSFLFPTYYQQYDTVAYRIYRENLPGYTVVGINCNQTIPSSGAIHCITHCIASYNPLLISLQRLGDTYNTTLPYSLDARILNKSGIQSAMLYWTLDTTQTWQSVNMNLSNPGQGIYHGQIPPQAAGTTVYYYVQAQAVNGKVQHRPLSAPQGWYSFKVLQTSGIEEEMATALQRIFPNPASAITCIPVQCPISAEGSLAVFDMNGRCVQQLFQGKFPEGKSHYFLDASMMQSGMYIVKCNVGGSFSYQKLLVK